MDSTVVSHAFSSLPWYLVRAFGIASVVLLILLVISGIGMITGFTFKYWPPVKAWLIHRAIGLAFLATLAGHIFFLLIDKYVNYSLVQILVPFATSSIWLSIGIIAFYFILIIIISSLTIKNTNKKTWKLIHYLSYLSFVLVFFHALNMGTDLKSGILRSIWIIIGIIVFFGILSRMARSSKIE